MLAQAHAVCLALINTRMLLAQAHAVCLVSACIGMLLWYLHLGAGLSHFVLRIAQTKNSHPALASSCPAGLQSFMFTSVARWRAYGTGEASLSCTIHIL